MTDLRETVAAEIVRVYFEDGSFMRPEKMADAVLAIARPAIIEECAKVAEGPLYKEHYRGTEHGNWSIDGNSVYGKGRIDAARVIRALAEKP